METERIMIAEIYKEGGVMGIELTRDTESLFELYGFLCIYLQGLEQTLFDRMNEKDKD